MNLQIPIRSVLGIVFATIGYNLAIRFLIIEDAGVRTGVYFGSIIVFGAIGVFLVPIFSEWVRFWSSIFAQRVAKEVISQLPIPRIRRNSNKKRKDTASYLNPIVVDTSVLIDGRIGDVVDSGFLFGTLIIPRFVLSELHHIADSTSALRRGKGRRGLQVLESLKKSKLVKAVIYNEALPEEKNIDDKLVVLAKILKAKILTTDFNLNKVATVSGIKVLNVNELVNALKTTLLPGEILEVKVIQEGKEKNQGIAYLQDGTMIVVEGGNSYVGKTIPVKVSRELQTVAGRMVFAQVTERAENVSSK
ncbi:TRAM domain-containing protein [Patescibacteria group bacterium]|nr:TRAM domain-containing protein [Patescibacteria group bacterium]